MNELLETFLKMLKYPPLEEQMQHVLVMEVKQPGFYLFLKSKKNQTKETKSFDIGENSPSIPKEQVALLSHRIHFFTFCYSSPESLGWIHNKGFSEVPGAFRSWLIL